MVHHCRFATKQPGLSSTIQPNAFNTAYTSSDVGKGGLNSRFRSIWASDQALETMPIVLGGYRYLSPLQSFLEVTSGGRSSGGKGVRGTASSTHRTVLVVMLHLPTQVKIMPIRRGLQATTCRGVWLGDQPVVYTKFVSSPPGGWQQ